MHWLVEVSRVGDTAPSERYCIDARRWQSALQEARRLRGDSGPLPKLTIELLDEGYRAVDPALNVRYLVTEAPPGMPLTGSARLGYSTAPPPAIESSAPSASRPPGASSAPTASAKPAAPVGPRGPQQNARRADGPANAARVDVAAERVSAPPLAAGVTGASRAGASLPILAQVIKQRDEKASEVNPIAYRELALSVRPGAQREDVEALLLSRWEEVRALMPDAGRTCKLRVDHLFVKRPGGRPLEWCGRIARCASGCYLGSERARAPPPPRSPHLRELMSRRIPVRASACRRRGVPADLVRGGRSIGVRASRLAVGERVAARGPLAQRRLRRIMRALCRRACGKSTVRRSDPLRESVDLRATGRTATFGAPRPDTIAAPVSKPPETP